MDISVLGNEQVRNVLREAVKRGMVSEDNIEQMVMESPTNEMKILVDAVHTLLCRENHDTVCHYYNEESTSTEKVFLGGYHKIWTGEVMELMNLLEMGTVAEMINLVRKISNTLADLEQYHPGASVLLSRATRSLSLSEAQPKTCQKTDPEPLTSPPE